MLTAMLISGLVLLPGGCHPAAGRGIDPEVDIRRHPGLWTEIGRSVEKRPVYVHEYGAGDSVVLVMGSMHGNEEVGGQVVAFLAEEIALRRKPPTGRRIVFVPVVNPDGVLRGRRWNARGVDINRNFPTANWEGATREEGTARHGEAPGSEPETRLVMSLLERYRPFLIITLHAPLHVVNFDGPAHQVSEGMGARNGYPVSGSIGYPTPGSFGTYAGVERGIPTITLELPRIEAGEAWEQNREALWYAILEGGRDR